MRQRIPLTVATIPLFASDEELGEVILGFDRRHQFRVIARMHERAGMPKFSEVWGGRYAPAVLAFIEKQYGWNGHYAGGDPGVEGVYQERGRARLRSSREIEALSDDPNNRRELYRRGKVRVHWADGCSHIEDAKPTDPKSWQKAFEPEPPKKRKLTPRTPPTPPDGKAD